MSSSKPLLIEIGTEELPTKSVAMLGKSFLEGIQTGLDTRGLRHGEARWFAGPRRLAALLCDVQSKAADKSIEVLGPTIEAARDKDGKWTKAATGFAKKNGVTADKLSEKQTEKGMRLAFYDSVEGASIKQCLNDIIKECIKSLPIDKRMRWGAKRLSFVRPVHWIIAMHGKDVFSDPVLEIIPGNLTRGHSIHCSSPIEIEDPIRYEETLEGACVIADFEKRRGVIKEQLLAEGVKLGAEVVMDEDLLDEVTSLCEWPVALSGRFDEEFLSLPHEALVLAMKTHQKYFPLVDQKNNLLPNFITICNIKSKAPDEVVRGNERVIRPRLSDAAFFFNSDKDKTLESRCAGLNEIVFQDRLGSLLDKVHRIESNACYVAKTLGANQADVSRASRLCKADLSSSMVIEFPKMQGIAGRHYALHDGEPISVASAIEQHYWPFQAGSKLPETPISVCVALADRVDTLAGIFGIGLVPTGSKDPFALRRASFSILRILIEGSIFLDLRHFFEYAMGRFEVDQLDTSDPTECLRYVMDRLRSYYEDDGVPVQVFRSVETLDLHCPHDIDLRVRAVNRFASSSAFQSLASTNKRVVNILSKSNKQSNFERVDQELFNNDFEKRLSSEVADIKHECSEMIAQKNYFAALELVSSLNDPLAAFFDQVMVNCDDEQLRKNRISLLKSVHDELIKVADIALLAGG